MIRIRDGVGWLAMLASAASCATITQTTLNATGARQAPREPTCAFEMLTVAPFRPFVEAGVVSVDIGDGQPASFTDVNAFKSQISHEVCLAGGDAALAIPYLGRYTVATVIKYTTAREPSGCAYDTQCKGNRVCVRGTCVEPGAASPVSQGP